jgi:hypothetical protein
LSCFLVREHKLRWCRVAGSHLPQRWRPLGQGTDGERRPQRLLEVVQEGRHQAALRPL